MTVLAKQQRRREQRYPHAVRVPEMNAATRDPPALTPAEATKQGRSFTPPAQLLGVNVRPLACLLEPGPLTYLFGLGFLQPTKKRRLAAGHGELSDLVYLSYGARRYHPLPRGNVS